MELGIIAFWMIGSIIVAFIRSIKVVEWVVMLIVSSTYHDGYSVYSPSAPSSSSAYSSPSAAAARL